MGTPELAVPILKSLLDNGHSVTTVITQPDRPVGRKQVLTSSPIKLFAVQRGLNVVQPLKIRTEEARAQFEPILKQQDVSVVAAYGRILPKWMLDAPRYGSINVHFSLLPKYRGAAPINWAIANGEKETGVTVMQMDEGLDTGPMLAQRATPIHSRETAPELSIRLAEIGAEMIVDVLKMVQANTITAIPQDDEKATLAPILKREDGRIDWNLSATDIVNRIRGFAPFPGCYAFYQQQRLEIVKAEAIEDLNQTDARGTVVDVVKDAFSVLCASNSTLKVTEVQPEGRRAMAVRDFLNGANLMIGMRLE